MKALIKFPNKKLPGNVDIAKEFYKACWNDLKTPLLLSVNKAFQVEELDTSQKPAVIEVIDKKTKINDFSKLT